MWYFITYALLAVWVFFDATKRKNHIIGWPLVTIILGPIALPVYLSKRHLKEGEIREGGTAWNVLKNFVLFWTLTLAVFAFADFVSVANFTLQSTNGAAQVGAAIGGVLGLGFIGFIWFIVSIAALVLGLILKKSSIVEKGPTGPLAT